MESITQLSGSDQLLWHLGVICPVAYASGYPIPKKDLNKRTDGVIIERARRLMRDRFSVFLNANEVTRRVSLPEYRESSRKNRAEFNRLMKRGLGYDVTCFRSPAGFHRTLRGIRGRPGSATFPKGDARLGCSPKGRWRWRLQDDAPYGRCDFHDGP